jgi:hypothetical protein
MKNGLKTEIMRREREKEKEKKNRTEQNRKKKRVRKKRVYICVCSCACVAYASAAKERRREEDKLAQRDILRSDMQQTNDAKCKMCSVDYHLSNNDEHIYKETKQNTKRRVSKKVTGWSDGI